MQCNNSHCLWNAYEQCCPESEEQLINAIPNTLDCPSSYRVDFEKQLALLVEECSSLLCKRTMQELLVIKRFIESQRSK